MYGKFLHSSMYTQSKHLFFLIPQSLTPFSLKPQLCLNQSEKKLLMDTMSYLDGGV